MGNFLFKIRGFTPLVFVIIALVWAELNPILLGIGFILAISGELLRIRSIRSAGGATRTREVGAPFLVTDGPYAYTRNPLYTANILIYTGFALASGALLPYLTILALFFFIFQYTMIVRLEEQTLIGIFGEEYEKYRETVPRIIPRLRAGVKHFESRFSLAEALRQEKRTLQSFTVVWVALAIRFIFF